jgi:hypothetical protein
MSITNQLAATLQHIDARRAMIARFETHLQILTTPAIFTPTVSVTLPVRSVSQDRSLPTVMASAYEWAVPAKLSSRGLHGGSFNFMAHGL